jgi:transcriptional regulator with XRE-family HTH domain
MISPQRSKNARAEQGLTNQALSDQSGVSYSTVCKISADTQDNPKVSDAIALIDTLGLSADEVFGLQPAYEREVLLQRIRELTAENERLANGTEQLSNQRDRVHKLELENVRLQGEVNRLNAINDGLMREKGRLTNELASRKPIIYILLFLAGILEVSLGYYLVMDFHLGNKGLILFGQLSIYAAVLFLVFIIGLGAIAWIALRQLRAWRKG